MRKYNLKKIQRRVKNEAFNRRKLAKYKAIKIYLKDLPRDIENIILKKLYKLEYAKNLKEIKKIKYKVCNCGCSSSFRKYKGITTEYYNQHFLTNLNVGFEELWVHKYKKKDYQTEREKINVLYYSPLEPFDIDIF